MTFLVAAVPSLKPSVREERTRRGKEGEKGKEVSRWVGKEREEGEGEVVELSSKEWLVRVRGAKRKLVRTLEPSGDILEVLHSSGSGLIGEKKTREGRRRSRKGQLELDQNRRRAALVELTVFLLLAFSPQL